MFPVKEQGNIYLIQSPITNCALILVLLPCPCMKEEGSQDCMFSWTRSSCHHTDVVLEVWLGNQKQCSIAMPVLPRTLCKFQVCRTGILKFYHLHYYGFVIKSYFYPGYSLHKSYPPMINVQTVLWFWTFNPSLSSSLCSFCYKTLHYHKLLRWAGITRLQNSLHVIWFNAWSLNVHYWFIKTVFSVSDI